MNATSTAALSLITSSTSARPAEAARVAATVTASRFAMTCAVSIDIAAPRAKVWALLVDAGAQVRWNSTVTRLDGTIAVGQRLSLEVAAAPGRTFKPRVSELEPQVRMVWRDGFAPMFQGVRSFELVDLPDGGTRFTMRERFSGLMLPMIKRALPDFAPVFSRYAHDLERAALS